jgi:hypothetical protein
MRQFWYSAERGTSRSIHQFKTQSSLLVKSDCSCRWGSSIGVFCLVCDSRSAAGCGRSSPDPITSAQSGATGHTTWAIAGRKSHADSRTYPKANA